MPSFGSLWATAGLIVAGGAAAGAPAGAIFGNGFEALPVVTVFEVQTGLAGGTVQSVGRVVTSRSRDQRHLWIADALAAAPYEGVYVYRGSAADVLPADIAVGTRVDVVGTVSEFDLGMGANPAAGDTLTQLDNAAVTFADPAVMLPVPIGFAGVSPLASIVDGEPWEGVLVRVDHVRVAALLPGNRVEVEDASMARLVLDDDAFAYPPPALGTCYASITGIMHLNIFDDQRRLLPRSAADMAVGDGCN